MFSKKFKDNKLLLVIGTLIITATAALLIKSYNPTIDQIPTHWDLDGRPAQYGPNNPLIVVVYVSIQVGLLWGMIALNAVLKDEKLLAQIHPPFGLSLVTTLKNHPILISKMLLPYGVLTLLNFTYLGYASLRAYTQINSISIVILLLSTVVFIGSIYLLSHRKVD